MVIDTSALLAILKADPEALALITALSRPGAKWISTATLLETPLVMDRQEGEAGQTELERVLATAAITPVPLEEAPVHRALEGWRLLQLRPGPGHEGTIAVQRQRFRGHRSADCADTTSAIPLADWATPQACLCRWTWW